MYLYRDLKNKHAEIWIPESFFDRHPSEANSPPVVREWQASVAAKTNILPINFLSHSTHNKAAESIRGNGDKFTFIPKAKSGKVTSEENDTNKTYEPYNGEGFLEIVPSNSTVLPGKFSWWGISSTNCGGTEIQKLVELKGKNSDPLVEVDFLKHEDQIGSRYGNREFISFLPN